MSVIIRNAGEKTVFPIFDDCFTVDWLTYPSMAADKQHQKVHFRVSGEHIKAPSGNIMLIRQRFVSLRSCHAGRRLHMLLRLCAAVTGHSFHMTMLRPAALFLWGG